MFVLVFSLIVPAALVALAVVQPLLWIAFGIYVVAFSVFTWPPRLGRAGFFPRCAAASRPVVLGGGWSWVLQRRACPPNVILCAQGYTGEGRWWHAGTTIRELQHRLALEGLTLSGHPSILSATLGGWIASRSHGTGGSLWVPSMGRVRVDTLDANDVLLPSKAHVAADMIIRQVEITPVKNVVCERRLSYLEDAASVRDALFVQATYLRAVFVDAYRCLCIAWVPTEDQTPVPWTADVPPLWLMTLLPARFRKNLTLDSWRRRMTLRAASAFAPDPPFLFAASAMYTHTNFEVFVTEPSTPALIWTVCSTFRDLFARGALRGRLELRFGKGKQFLDFDLLGPATGFHHVFDALRTVYGANVRYELHRGKAQVGR